MIDGRPAAAPRAAAPMPDNAGLAGAQPGTAFSLVTSTSPSDRHRMTPLERRASGSLALVFAARMLGLFLVLPVFALEAARYPGGDDSDRFGR